MTTRWGIVGTGRIASDFARDLARIQDAEIVAVASRTASGAVDFARPRGIPHAYGSLDELSARTDIDVVYIAGIHPVHLPHATAMLRADKHVLVEKPLALDAREVATMIATAKESRRFLMEAMWMRFNPLHVEIKRRLDAGEFGRITHIDSDFSFSVPFDLQHRLFDPAKGGGAMRDVGIYPLTLAWWFLGRPDAWSARGTIGSTGVDEAVETTMSWNGGATATLTCASRREGTRASTITCERATIDIPGPSHASNVADIRTSSGIERVECAPSGLHHQVVEVQRCIDAGLLESPRMTHTDSLAVTSFMDDVISAISKS